MEPNFEQLKKIKLSDGAKARMWGVLAHYLKSGVRTAGDGRSIMIQRSTLTTLTYKVMPLFAIVALIALAGGGVSAAAEGTIPGDALYPVKVYLNEEVRGVFAFSEEAKAQWDARVAERRLGEAASLASEGNTDAELYEKLKANFDDHAERVNGRISDIEARGNVKDAAELASRFEASLTAHEDILARLGSIRDGEVAAVKVRVEARLDEAKKARLSLESRVADENKDGPENQFAAEGKLKAAESYVSSTRAYLEARKVRLGSDAVVVAEAKLVLAGKLLAEAKVKLEAKSYGEAFGLANRAMRAAQEARLLVDVSLRIDPEVLRAANEMSRGSLKIKIESEDDELNAELEFENEDLNDDDLDDDEDEDDDDEDDNDGEAQVEVHDDGSVEIQIKR